MMNAARQRGGPNGETPAAQPGSVPPQGTLAVVRTEDVPPAGPVGMGAMAGSAEPQGNNSEGQPQAGARFFAMGAGSGPGWAPAPSPVPDTNDPNDPNNPNAPERRP